MTESFHDTITINIQATDLNIHQIYINISIEEENKCT